MDATRGGQSPAEQVKISDNRPFLSAVLIFLLLVLTSSHTVAHIAPDDHYFADASLSTVGTLNNTLGTPGNDLPDLHHSPEWVKPPLGKTAFTSLANTGTTTGTAYTVSQARAPPLL